MPKIFFNLVFLSALLIQTHQQSSTPNQCPHQDLSALPNNSDTIITTLASLIANIKIPLIQWYPLEHREHEKIVNISISGSNYSTSFSDIRHDVTLEIYMCNFTNFFQFVFRPAKESLHYQGSIFISDRLAGSYSLNFTNPTYKFILNVNSTDYKTVENATKFDYQNIDIEIKASAEDNATIAPFLASIQQQIESISKTTLDQELVKKLNFFDNDIKTLIPFCRNSFHNENLYYHSSTSGHYTYQNSDLDLTFDLTTVIIEGLSRLQSATFFPIYRDDYQTYGVELEFSDPNIYTTWQYSNKGKANTTETLQLQSDVLRLQGAVSGFANRAFNDSNVRFGFATPCRPSYLQTLLGTDTILRNVELVAQQSLRKSFEKYH